MAELGGPGSWLTLISGVAAGEPSGGGDGLLFPSAAALSLQRRDKRRGRMEGGPSVQEGVPLTGKAPADAPGTPMWKCVCTCVSMCPRGPMCGPFHTDPL